MSHTRRPDAGARGRTALRFAPRGSRGRRSPLSHPPQLPSSSSPFQPSRNLSRRLLVLYVNAAPTRAASVASTT
eukprot:68684-Pleurochrysis_carterae.AAC.1